MTVQSDFSISQRCPWLHRLLGGLWLLGDLLLLEGLYLPSPRDPLCLPSGREAE